MSGFYESRYLRAVDPAAPRGVWIRHTVLRRPGGAPAGSLWCTLWEESGPPVAVKETKPGGTFTTTAISGSASAAGTNAAWDLRVTDASPPLRHLPVPRAPLPRTKLESPAPFARFHGTVSAGGRTLELDGWPGMVGHNWGAQHAERWLWLHGVGFEGAPDAWLDVAVGRVKIGPALTPWIANGALHSDGARRTLRGVADVDARPGEARVTIGATRIHVTAPLDRTIAWTYADPPGGEHHSLNCSVAALAADGLATAHGGVYELGIRERDHGVRVAPFPDP